MCGANALLTELVSDLSSRARLNRNGSSNSSLVNYCSGLKDDAVAQDLLACNNTAASSEAWDTSMMADGGVAAASTCCSALSSFDVQQQEFHTTQCAPAAAAAPAVQAASQQLLLGTSAGLYQLDLATQQLQQLALASVPVAHVCYSSCGLVLAACPVSDECLYGSSQAVAAAKEAAGLYCLNLRQRQGSCCSSSTGRSFGGAASGGRCTQAIKLWQGGATCCAFGPPSQPGCEGPVLPRIYLGTQPADLIYSDNLGASWASCALSKAPQADDWFRRLPPYEPSVRAINFSSSTTTTTAAAAAGEVQQQQKAELLVAVEVGGVLSSAQQQEAQPGASGWADCSQGLCRDVHALQADPFNPRMLYAVSGSGHLPGGLYRCKGKGQKWKRLFGYRYAVGMAISPYQKGHMLLVTADKAPATGCNLFESVDGGRCWRNLTDDVADAAAALTDHAPELFDQAPLAMFVPGGVIIGCASGHLFHGSSKPTGGFTDWKLLATAPAAINCMCSTDAAVAPVAVQRS